MIDFGTLDGLAKLGLALIAFGLAAIDGRLLNLFRRASLPQAA